MCSGTSQSFSNIPELWTIEGRTKSPVSQQSPTSCSSKKMESDFSKSKLSHESQNVNNNNSKENQPSMESNITSMSGLNDQQEVEEAIDVLQNLDNWTD